MRARGRGWQRVVTPHAPTTHLPHVMIDAGRYSCDSLPILPHVGMRSAWLAQLPGDPSESLPGAPAAQHAASSTRVWVLGLWVLGLWVLGSGFWVKPGKQAVA